MAACPGGGGALRVDTASSSGLNSSASPSSVGEGQNRLLQVSSSSTTDSSKQEVQMRRQRTGSSSSMDNPFRPESALSLEVDEFMKNLRIVKDGDRLVLKIDQDGKPSNGTANGTVNGYIKDHSGQQNGVALLSDEPKQATQKCNGNTSLDAVDNEAEVHATTIVKVEATPQSCHAATRPLSGIVEVTNGGAPQPNQVEKVRVARRKRCELM